MSGNKIKLIFFIFCLIMPGQAVSATSVISAFNGLMSSDTVLTYRICKTDEQQCTEWEVPEREDVLTYLYVFAEVTGQEWNDCYGDWNCGIEGEIIIGGRKCCYRLDAGGWIILNDGKRQQYFVCKRNKSCWNYFPSECFCDEEDYTLASTVCQKLLSKEIEIELPEPFHTQQINEVESISFVYSFPDSACIIVSQGGLISFPTDAYQPAKTEERDGRKITTGICNDRFWRIDRFEGIIIYYDNVSFPGKSKYDRILDSVKISSLLQ